jgi:hypothetical protein
MRVASLHRFLPGRIVANPAWYALMLSLAAIALLAFGASGVAAAGGPVIDPHQPFRW